MIISWLFQIGLYFLNKKIIKQIQHLINNQLTIRSINKKIIKQIQHLNNILIIWLLFDYFKLDCPSQQQEDYKTNSTSDWYFDYLIISNWIVLFTDKKIMKQIQHLINNQQSSLWLKINRGRKERARVFAFKDLPSVPKSKHKA